ncbi:MAG TPA: exo-alpha-sialidase [Verrucomicrobiae bacterium]|nr:exo-alpha-sialidase [Verrucomicrobiae bacterium]
MKFIPVSLLLGCAFAVTAAEPELLSVRKIWDQGGHNAFTDLIRFQDKWFCSFREGDGHVGGDGRLRILESSDGEAWKSAALLSEGGIDLRDPKLSITPDERLMVVAGGSVYGGTKKLQGCQPRVAFSTDGREWTPTRRVLQEGEWLWRVTWHDGRAYGVSYSVASGKSERTVKLYSSVDGSDWKLTAPLDVMDQPNETTIRFLRNGEAMMLVRREGGDRGGWIGSSQPPYRDWKFAPTTVRLGGPDFIELPDGSLVAGSRDHSQGAVKFSLFRMTRDSLTPALTLPSGGDCSYPALVWHDGLLWVSYYSSHEGQTSIYLAKVKWPLATRR